MEEKNVIKISLSTFFIIIAMITICVMGFFIYKLNNEKTTATEQISSLNNQINNMKNTVNTLQENINTISTVNNPNSIINENNTNNNTQKTYELNGEYQDNTGYEIFTYSFSGNTVTASSLYTSYGTYQIVNNTVKITYTKAKDPEGNEIKEFPNGQTDELTILDENTLVGNNSTKYIKKVYQQNEENYSNNQNDLSTYLGLWGKSNNYLYIYSIDNNEIIFDYTEFQNGKDNGEHNKAVLTGNTASFVINDGNNSLNGKITLENNNIILNIIDSTFDNITKGTIIFSEYFGLQN